MKRVLKNKIALAALFMSLIVIMSSCSKSKNLLTVENSKKVLTVAVQNGMDEFSSETINYFCEKVDELSKGELKIESVLCDDALNQFDGKADLIFAPNSVIARANRNFSSFSSPFYFSNYDQLTMTLNSESFLNLSGDITRSIINADPLGAFYDGNSVFLSIRDITFDNLKGVKVYINDNELLNYFLKQMGAEVVNKQQEDIIEGFNSGRYHFIECNTDKLKDVVNPSKGETLAIYQSFHNAKINWLMFNNESKASLTKKQQAILKEAAAYAVSKNDECVRTMEAENFKLLSDYGFTVAEIDYNELNEQFSTVILDSVKYNSLWNWEIHEQIRSITNLS